MNEPDVRTYIVSGSRQDLDAFEAMLGYMNYLKAVGMSRTVRVYCYGDGPMSLVFRNHVRDKLVCPEPRNGNEWEWNDAGMSVGFDGPFAADPYRSQPFSVQELAEVRNLIGTADDGNDPDFTVSPYRKTMRSSGGVDCRGQK